MWNVWYGWRQNIQNNKHKIICPYSLSPKDNVKLTKQLNEGFKRHVYGNEYQTKTESKDLNNDHPIRIYLNASFQRVKWFLVLGFDTNDNGNKKVERNSHIKYFFQK